MTAVDFPAFVDQLATISGEAILPFFRTSIGAHDKSGGAGFDPVTEADRAGELVMRQLIRQNFPAHGILGEEFGASATDAEYVWVLDPIDGTVNFAAKLPHFCTSIALATPDRRPVLGVIYDPTRDELFSAVRGGGAFLNGRPLRVTGIAELSDAVVSTGFPYDKHTNPDNNAREWTEFLKHIRGERRLGSAALDLAYVAAARLDGYWEKDLKPYDAMAGVLLVEEAGGRVSDYTGAPDPQRADRGRYVASNGLIHEAMLRVLGSTAISDKR